MPHHCGYLALVEYIHDISGLFAMVWDECNPPIQPLSRDWFCTLYASALTHRGSEQNWRRVRDSNPRCPFGTYSLSRGAPSTDSANSPILCRLDASNPLNKGGGANSAHALGTRPQHTATPVLQNFSALLKSGDLFGDKSMQLGG
jgi:hypothetical protein